MFEAITKNLTEAISTIARGRLTEANIRDGMKQVRQALLEADVNYDVATAFIGRVTEQAVGDRVLKSLKPSEQIIGIVYQELVQLMGAPDHTIPIKRDGITILMMCGLQGSGKTTTCGKLAKRLKASGYSPMLVAADLQRPAAIEQLKVIGERIGVPVYSEDPQKSNPVQVCKNGLREAQKANVKVLILDTAGRLHVDDALMKELEQIDTKLGPDQAILVCDAMTGQDAVNSAKAFNEALELDGVILTKLDGDTRGGAALSVRAVTGVPIKYIGVGEDLDGLEEFHPDRMAQRILGGGDIMTLAEKAQQVMDEQTMLEQQKKMAEGRFSLVDFQKAMHQIRKLGPMKNVMKMIPGLGGVLDLDPDMEDPEESLTRIDGIINSMTPQERENPDRIDRGRRNRIARGSGNEPHEVNNLLKQFKAMSGMMQQMAGLGMRDRMRAVKQMADGGMFHPGANIKREKQRSKRGPLDKEKMRDKKKQQRKDSRKAKKRNRR